MPRTANPAAAYWLGFSADGRRARRCGCLGGCAVVLRAGLSGLGCAGWCGALVESGTIDCIWGCFSMDGREEVYRWAGPYMVSRQVAAVDADSSIRTLGDLAGKTIAVQSTGKPEEIFLSGSDPRIPQAVDVFSTEDRSVQYAMLACGYVDAIAAHETAILQYMKDNSVEFRILEEPLLITGLGIAFAKNDSRGLDIQLNAVLAQMRTDGTLEQILGKYLEHASQYLEVDTIGT